MTAYVEPNEIPYLAAEDLRTITKGATFEGRSLLPGLTTQPTTFVHADRTGSGAQTEWLFWVYWYDSPVGTATAKIDDGKVEWTKMRGVV